MAAVELDGMTLEGGGQLLRLGLSLSSLTGIPVHVTHIRGKRGAISAAGVGKDGGLKPAHLAAVRWLAKATAATTEGMELDSLDPAILPYVLYLPSPVPLRITIQGGTNVTKSPSIEYISQVLLPLLSIKLGIQPILVNVHKRGWSIGRRDVGSATFDITPIQKGSIQPAFEFTDQGKVEKVHISVIAPDDGTRKHIRTEALKQLGEVLPKAELLLTVDEDSGNSQQIYFLLVAETSTGFRLSRDCLSRRRAHKARGRKSNHTAEEENVKLVSSVVKDLQNELLWGGCVDEYMEDQLVVFQALAHGRSEVDAGKGRQASLHTQTARWIAERVLGVFFEEGICNGVSFKLDEGLEQPRGADKTTT